MVRQRPRRKRAHVTWAHVLNGPNGKSGRSEMILTVTFVVLKCVFRCSKTCGEGQRRRSRFCNTYYGCPGESMETGTCNERACDVTGPWTSWSKCSKFCGKGQRFLRHLFTVHFQLQEHAHALVNAPSMAVARACLCRSPKSALRIHAARNGPIGVSARPLVATKVNKHERNGA